MVPRPLPGRSGKDLKLGGIMRWVVETLRYGIHRIVHLMIELLLLILIHSHDPIDLDVDDPDQ